LRREDDLVNTLDPKRAVAVRHGPGKIAENVDNAQ